MPDWAVARVCFTKRKDGDYGVEPPATAAEEESAAAAGKESMIRFYGGNHPPVAAAVGEVFGVALEEVEAEAEAEAEAVKEAKAVKVAAMLMRSLALPWRRLRVLGRRWRLRVLLGRRLRLRALQQSTAGRDISVIAKFVVEKIVAAPAFAVCKKLTFDLICSTRLTTDLWDTVYQGIKSDLHLPDLDVTTVAISILAAIPSHLLAKLFTECNSEISGCFDSSSDNLRFSITETLGCILARDDLVHNLVSTGGEKVGRVEKWLPP
ncbi:protein TPLATE [Tripterygium wilfordii]|uniref:Protein TPLATE n=1 Tax=Tripterygium wilfordii TaxID=458696 RepID=A0A7J7DVF4_TRIWF|nr:protein TPLATE [Tripterygium wilfordii]